MRLQLYFWPAFHIFLWTSIYERTSPKYEVWTKNLPDDDMGTHQLTRQETSQTGAVQDEYRRRLEHEVEDREPEVMRRDVWRFLSETKVKVSEEKILDSMNGRGANPSHLASSQFDTLRRIKRLLESTWIPSRHQHPRPVSPVPFKFN